MDYVTHRELPMLRSQAKAQESQCNHLSLEISKLKKRVEELEEKKEKHRKPGDVCPVVEGMAYMWQCEKCRCLNNGDFCGNCGDGLPKKTKYSRWHNVYEGVTVSGLTISNIGFTSKKEAYFNRLNKSYLDTVLIEYWK